MAERINPPVPEKAFYPPLSPLSTEGSPSLAQPPIIEYGSIPRPEVRSFSEQARHTAAHELNHALIAIKKGVMPVSLSVIPEGNSLGRTIFAGEIGTETFKVIAAGGAVETPFGEASGFGSDNHPGSDFSHIHSLQMQYGGIGIEEAVNSATHYVNSVPENIRERTSEIIATLGNISGEEIPTILRIAELEVQHGITVAPTIEATIENIKQNPTYTDAVSSGRKTIIGIDEYGRTQEPVVVEEEQVCSLCGGKDVHTITCQQKEEEFSPSQIKSSGTIIDFASSDAKAA